jgi:hypothetical protein
MLTRTPCPTDPHVKDFCRRVVTDAKPLLLPIVAEPGAEPLDCFNNVRRKVAKEGGRVVYGWAVWEWPGVYIEAEHHAVYEPSPEHGRWMDITPSGLPGISSRVFIEDASAIYDFDNEGIRRDNHRHALKRDPLIQDFFAGAQAVNAAMNALPGVGEIAVTPAEARKIQGLQMQQARLTFALAMKYLTRNDPCFCGSGKKFKACHGVGR